MIKIRKFSLSDLENVMEIEKVSFPDPWSKSYLKKLYKKYPDDFIVAEISNKIIGYILGYKKSDWTGSIKTISVDPSFRHQGVGKELVNFTLNKLKGKEIKEVFLHTRTKNKAASLFYKNLGFKILKTIKNYYSNGDDAYLMKKEI